MTKKNIRNNIKYLRTKRDRFIGKVSNSIQEKINNAVDLYEDRKISQLVTVEKLIDGLTTNNDKKQKQGLKNYEKAVGKAEAKERVSEKQQEALKKARQGKKEKKAGGVIASKAKNLFKNRKTYSIQYMVFTKQKIDKAKNGVKKNGVVYYPLLNPVKREANVKSNEFIEGVVKRMITKDDDRHLFKRLLLVMNTDKDYDMNLTGDFSHYVDAIRIEKIQGVDDTSAKDMDIKNEKLKSYVVSSDYIENRSIYHHYIQTDVNVDYSTIREAIENKNYKENECWINALVELFEGTELMRIKRGKLAKTLSREKVLELLQMSEEQFVANEASIIEMDAVFRYFNIPVRLYDFTNKIIYKHDPEQKTHNRIVTFNGLVKNNHVYVINYDLASLRQIARLDTFDFKVSKHYYLNDRTEPIKYKAFDNVDELLGMHEEEEYNLIQKDNNMTKVVLQLKKAGYEPFIKYQVGMISEVKVRFRFKKLRKTILYNIVAQNLSKQTVHSEVVVCSEDKYNKMTEEMFKFNKALCKDIHKSKYNEDTIKILDECRTIVPMGKLSDGLTEIKLAEIDENKAFTKAFQMIDCIATVSEFDMWMPYEGEDISTLDGLTLYYVEAFEGNLFFNKKYNLAYGYILSKLISYKVNFKIHYYIEPSHKHKVNYKQIVDDLWKANISDDKHEESKIKKSIANINFGLLEKSHNKGQKSKMFNSLRECCYYQNMFGGRVYSISLNEESELEMDDIDEFGCCRGSKQKTIEKGCYVLNVTDNQKLVDGFRLIKEMILQNHNLIMFEAYQKMIHHNVRVYSVKSDAFVVVADDLPKINDIMNMGSEIGQWKINHDINPTPEWYVYKYNNHIEISKITNEEIIVKDEWDTTSICNEIIVKSPCVIKGKFPGTGKSYIAEHFSKLGKRVLFVVPTNRLLQEKSVDATTYNKFFSVGVALGEKLAPFDYSSYDVICFDEVFMCNMCFLNKVRLFCLNNSDKIIVGTGDTKQLPSVECITNSRDKESYLNHCMNVIFKYNICLKICKRVGAKDSEEGEMNRKIINEMYDDFWIHKLKLKDIVMKHFPITDDIMASEHNIAYTNIRCRSVAQEVRNRLGKNNKYEVDDVLIARKWVEAPRVNVNLRYKILKVEGQNIRLQNIGDALDKFTMTESDVDNAFIYSHCATTHSSQGASINTTMTIHEWDRPYLITREWLWTSITRCVDFRKVKFYLNKKYDKVMELNMIKDYFKRKVDGYKVQDLKATRQIDEEEYVDVDFCIEKFKGNCENCNVKFDFEIKHGRLSSNFSAQRVSNEIAHYKSNCVGWCVRCNCSSR